MLLFKQNTLVGNGSPFPNCSAEHEEKEKSSRNPDWKSKDEQCSKASKKCAMPCHQHLGQILTNTPCKKENHAVLRKSSDVVREKHGKYAEPALSTSHAAGSKDSKSSKFSHNKENLKQKAEQEREHDSKPNKSFKSVMASSVTAEQQLPQTMKAFKENSSTSGFPDFTWAKGNLPVRIFFF